MELMINGEAQRFDSPQPGTVAELMVLLEVTEKRGVAVAVNDEVVSRRKWEESPVKDGDRVEIIRATQGG